MLLFLENLIILNKKKNVLNVKQIFTDNKEVFTIKQEQFENNENYFFDIRILGKEYKLIEKIRIMCKPLQEFCEIKQSIKTGNDKKYVVNISEDVNYKRVIGGKEISRYLINYGNRFVNYGKYLACPRDPYIFEVEEKILIRETGKRITATYDDEKYYLLSSIYSIFLKSKIELNLKYVLGIINSNISQLYMKELCFDNSTGAFIKARIFHYKSLPIRTIDFSNPAEKHKHDRMVSLVEQMLTLHKQLSSAKTSHEKTVIQRQIAAADNQIDKLVYELYELTEEEIKIVEEG